MSAAAYWNKTIKASTARSPKQGALKRLDRLRGVLMRLDPVVANRAWREVCDALDRIIERYSR